MSGRPRGRSPSARPFALALAIARSPPGRPLDLKLETRMAGRRTAISMGSVALARADGEGLRTRAHVPLDPALAVGVLAAIGMGVLAAYSAALAAVPALVLLAGLAVVRFGRMGLLQLLLACLPWMLVFDSLLPPLTRTFTTAAAAIALLAVVAPLRFDDWPVPVGAALFSAIVVGRAALGGG